MCKPAYIICAVLRFNVNKKETEFLDIIKKGSKLVQGGASAAPPPPWPSIRTANQPKALWQYAVCCSIKKKEQARKMKTQ
ncbi:hypothetical protein D910_01353 [Dendroctonus ponderosae]|uniref:Uncharacterized protein n=1 Tax=Dendroctonus ponderosae TaxID=77166 RepID=U4V0K1_DENPD|nr:hypothetical protein D910_01353 [Dendroctonus ponderosae]